MQVLILSERLQSISASFDACRSLRYQQLQTQRQRQQWRQKELQQAKVIICEQDALKERPASSALWHLSCSPSNFLLAPHGSQQKWVGKVKDDLDLC